MSTIARSALSLCDQILADAREMIEKNIFYLDYGQVDLVETIDLIRKIKAAKLVAESVSVESGHIGIK